VARSIRPASQPKVDTEKASPCAQSTSQMGPNASQVVNSGPPTQNLQPRCDPDVDYPASRSESSSTIPGPITAGPIMSAGTSWSSQYASSFRRYTSMRPELLGSLAR